ncbi:MULTISPECIES: tetratricopeptide repeat protein [unclassified Streptomyces]|uniref:tetratricopeptide repeat protein n=1 Tax=unclassified Streptomyces TaxID=2593676 RepID=UPI000DC76B7D|nr:MULTISPECIES: tetratricopeptide repeat protein [unclassified Streptomyces]AWZ09326.1 tetratricopeptide repeat protein [Streptomyces sp. ICC4]AWZ12571.1 tetratricopeptide repeat protein [Streptomyces sp. ICC1]
MSTMTAAEIRRALHENQCLPNGTARSAQAEALANAAEACGDSGLFRQALLNQIDAYEYSSERTRMVVPFARLLQEYDRDPGGFDGSQAHALFWRFKWVSGQLVSSPEIPLSSVTGWLEDMERRYRLAGYSERAVRQSEFYLADATGDDERAERAVLRWQAADRDPMSDCHACETNSQGWFWASRGDDAKAVDIWEPVLAGKQSCLEEPHRLLARSLLPLVRLGRGAEARAHHLRGYRMARGNESLLRSIGEHIEFCALTGNEARGLEILAEHAARLGPLVDVEAQMQFYGGILVLLRRLGELGHGADLSVSYEGAARTADELHGILREEALAIARRFDERNGTTRVSDRLAERIGRAPLLDALPLGVRSPALPPAASAPVPKGPGPASASASASSSASASAEGFAELVERARAARELGHPGADALWAGVAARPEAGTDPLVAADLADHRALTAARAGAPEAAELLAGVREGYRELGRAERAALAELRLATVAAQSGTGAGELRKLISVALRAAEALDADEPLRTRRIAYAELTSIRVESYLRSLEAAGDAHEHAHGHAHGGGQDHGHGELAAELRSFVDAYGPALPDVAAEAEEMLGRLALSEGDPERAVALLAACADRALASGRPWLAVDPLVLRAGVLLSLDRAEDAREAARAALAHASEVTDPETQGVVRLTLADVLVRRGEADAEAAGHALEAAHWFDQAGLSADGGAQARLLLARCHAREGRTAEAAEVLQSTLPDLLEHGEGQAVSVREFLGDLLRDLRDPRGAAEQYLLAAEATKDWEDPRPQAHFAQAAADRLSEAQLVPEAVAAYERALDLHRRSQDAPIAEVRILRSLAWLGLREEVSNAVVARARARMEEAVEVLSAVLAEDPEATEARAELAETWNQLAQVLDRRVSAHEEDTGEEEDGDGSGDGAGDTASGRAELLGAAELEALRLEEIRLWERAAALYAELGPAHLEARYHCVNNAAWTQHELGRPEAGAALLDALAAEVRALPEGTAPKWLTEQAERTRDNLLRTSS